ncbi:MAG: glutathione synthase [Myxococcota bacterium]|nr:glutathione synthase [Myxococcota bacterium]
MELLFLMDPLERAQPNADTTYALLRAAHTLGLRTQVGLASSLSLVGGTPMVRSRAVRVPGGPGAHFEYLGPPQHRRVDSFGCAWLRTDPPFNLAYVESTWILDRVDRKRTLLVNDPTGIRGANEKLYGLRFPQLCPPSLVTADRGLLLAFVAEHREVVLKPLDAAGGSGILFAQQGMRGLNSLLEVATEGGRRCEAQAYLAGASQGDKRILLLDGAPLGAILRVHGEGEERNNLHLGGHAESASLDRADREIIEALAPALREDGLYFVGIDVIGGKLTEVNVTSPTGIQEMSQFDGEDYAARVIRWCQERAADGLSAGPTPAVTN